MKSKREVNYKIIILVIAIILLLIILFNNGILFETSNPKLGVPMEGGEIELYDNIFFKIKEIIF